MTTLVTTFQDDGRAYCVQDERLRIVNPRHY